MDFKTFESLGDINSTKMYTERGGLLKKSPVVKKWDKIGVGKSQIEGLGVWAIESIVDNEIIEESPVIVVSKNDIGNTSLIDFAFKISEDQYAIALGSGSLYNHRNQPNIRWHFDETKHKIIFRASRPIEAGEELFISYGKDYFKSRNLNMKGDINATNTSKTQ